MEDSSMTTTTITGHKFNALHRAASRSDDISSINHDGAPAICRICRGEGTPEEPLFYPCKCSGSIKYVHQDCLMEWLSHSQKKYCELCKTSFRFTKLYAPDMPQSLPIHVFLGHMAKYLFRNLLVWVRAAVAFSVWLGWLPYFMRSVWSFLFWVSDEGLGSSSLLSRSNNSIDAAYELYASALGINTCPVSPLLEPTTTPALAAEAIRNNVSDQNISELLISMLFGSFGIGVQSNTVGNATNQNATNLGRSGPSSLLTDVGFLQNLTRNPTINRAVVSVLEGQIITVLVIVCFILVILVRDYVVQQQPEINMRAAFAPAGNPLQQQEQLDVRPEDVENLRGPEESDESDEETLDNGETSHRTGDMNDNNYEVRHRFPSHHDYNEVDHEETGSSSALPESQGQFDYNTYASIARRANFDSERMAEIIREEGLDGRLPWIENGRRNLWDQTDSAAPFTFTGTDQIHPALYHNHPESSGSTARSSSRLAHTPESDEALDQLHETDHMNSRKGKEKAFTPNDPWREEDALASGAQSGPSRPRAVSDGPQLHNNVNPLANNSWSFANLPSEPENETLFREASHTERLGTQERTVSAFRLTENDPWAQIADASEQDDLPRKRHRVDDNDEDSDPTEQPEPQAAEQVPVVGPGAVENLDHDNDQNIGLVGRVTDFMWGDLVHGAENQVPLDDPLDDPWVDVGAVEAADVPEVDNDARPEEVDAPPGALDAEAVDDLEDFEGIMELIGMRGPVAGLFQNAIFCAVLVSLTILSCIFLPYNIGRISVWILANPMRLVRLLFELSKLLQDAAVLVAGLGSWFALNLVDIFTNLIGGGLASQILAARKASWTLWTTAGSRVLEYAFMDFPMSASEVQNFSAISHGALLTVKGHVGSIFSTVGSCFSLVFGGSSHIDGFSLDDIISASKSTWTAVLGLSSILMNPNSWVIDLGETEKISAVNPELTNWSGTDRFWAILAGYLTLFMIGALYLKRGSPFSRGNVMQAWEAGVIDTLHQASGIMKVILIISIEMLVFPLYCGLLLDGALLPLFENATFKSRILFTYSYPLTSIFVHWFVGTGYMFHFALFVSMCRKIMRQGVLYFIRDPDDPEFHPVRDVLERNLSTQLRKILFSAFVYGALVIVCLGGVVWGLWFAMPNVLPVHYSSNEPVLEFPVDLLFYNFLMPLAVNFFKPGDGLHVMYTWWFKKCARGLRLTYFLFGERKIDEEGDILLADTPQNHDLPWYRTVFLQIDEENRVVPMKWEIPLEHGDEVPEEPAISNHDMSQEKAHLKEAGQLTESGRFVRAPASDRIRIPKGRKVFLDLSEDGERLDGKPENDLYSSDQYQMVYIPPRFRLRVFLFILFIWVFAAVTGVGFTIIPLVFGRKMFKSLLPEHIRTNDIYAFSIGVYLLGTFFYSAYRIARWRGRRRQQHHEGTDWSWVKTALGYVANRRRIMRVLAQGAKLVYAYFFILVVFPLLISTMMEFYVALPLHTYMHPPTAASIQASRTGGSEASQHTVRIVQAWVLGVLYLKLGTRVVTTLFRTTRLSTAVTVVLDRGWLHPDVGILTRAFVIPGLAIAVLATVGPPTLTSALIKYGIIPGAQPGVDEAAEAARLAIIYRLSYPALALAALFIKNTIGLVRVFHGWTARIRDEAYLIGERLHNFGAAAAGARRVRGAWRAGGARL